jgi:hypothetical protein
MALATNDPVKGDRERLIHPLHHPVDHVDQIIVDQIIYVCGRGATVQVLKLLLAESE